MKAILNIQTMIFFLNYESPYCIGASPNSSAQSDLSGGSRGGSGGSLKLPSQPLVFKYPMKMK